MARAGCGAPVGTVTESVCVVLTVGAWRWRQARPSMLVARGSRALAPPACMLRPEPHARATRMPTSA